MTPKDFLNQIRAAYLNARKCAFTSENHGIIKRGTSHSISSLSEDLLACYCADKVSNPKNIKILIDPPLSFKGTGLKNKSDRKSLLIRPDVALCKEDRIVCLFDIKTDLGYKRKIFLDQAKDRNNQMNFIKGKPAKINDGETKLPETFIIDTNVKFVYIIISQGNINRSTQENYIRNIKNLDNADIFVLSNGDHLNNYGEKPTWEINYSSFTALDNLIISYLNK